VPYLLILRLGLAKKLFLYHSVAGIQRALAGLCTNVVQASKMNEKGIA
jgi:hypothetical protein